MSRSPVPSLLPVIGWSMLGAVPALLLSGLLGFELIALAREPGAWPWPPGSPDGIDLKVLLLSVEEPLRLLSWIQVLMAPPLAGISTAFLRRKRWGRTGMEAITWAMGLLTVGFVWLIIPFAMGVMREVILPRPHEPLPPAARWLAVGSGAALVVLLEIPIGLTLRALRSETIRRACVL